MNCEPSKQAIEAAENSPYFYVFERQMPGSINMRWQDGLLLALKAAYAIDCKKRERFREEPE